MSDSDCVFCVNDGGEVLWRDDNVRVVLPNEPDYPGFLRVVWNAHVREMTDLAIDQRLHLMRVVWGAETALREVMSPDKVNLASFGNVVPHVHWHVIPRYQTDPHFPNPVWGQRVRETGNVSAANVSAQLKNALAAALAE